MTLYNFLSGAVALGYLVCGLFFLRFWRRTRDSLFMAFALASGLAVALGACDQPKQPTFQGWVEADLIFVAPDETGRVETLSVAEGDQVVTGAPLFTVDADLQKADLQMQEASLLNAQQAHDRAKELIKTGGENVYPADVEKVISEHQDIAEVAVIGVPDPDWGEAVKAVCVCRPASLVSMASRPSADPARWRIGAPNRRRNKTCAASQAS